MPAAAESKSRSLLGVTDLVVVADIKHGLIPALDSRSYRSRVQLLLRTLNTLRVSSLEADPTPLIADVVTRIQSIHSFRLAVLEQPGLSAKLMLNVVFDGGWEPYMRRIWRDLGPLLDVIFCNCEHYPISRENSYADYVAWVRRYQVTTEILYNASSLTVSDLVVNVRPSAPPGKVARAKHGEMWQQALPALVALYRLTDMYPRPVNRADGDVLLCAAQHLLGECHEQRAVAPKPRTRTEEAALRWFMQDAELRPKNNGEPEWKPANIQAGILEGYKRVTHGCTALLQLADAKAARALLDHLETLIVSAADQAAGHNRSVFVNVAFTLQGLHALGLDEATIGLMPQEFREGMAARASILGDYRYNHPTVWSLPRRNWPLPAEAGADRVELSSVHVVLLLQMRAQSSNDWWELDGARSRHPMAAYLREFDDKMRPSGITLLAVQGTQRFPEKHAEVGRDHFGFVDGISQPKLGDRGKPYDNSVERGDLLLGHRNSLKDPPLAGRLWKDSTFLVIRKLRQNEPALDTMLKRHEADGGRKAEGMKALMMGRRTNGENLIDHTKSNDFDYENDLAGQRCPFQSHVRRANPRVKPGARPDMVFVPRIMRRGMSYGPRHGAAADADRGLVFMAYNASIAEQFEVIQAWLSGGNSSDPKHPSRLRDPFLGVPQEGDPNVFEHTDSDGSTCRVDLGNTPFVKLEWGLYAFVPSIAALSELRAVADEADRHQNAIDNAAEARKKDRRERREIGNAQAGARFIAGLRLVEQNLGFDAAATQWKIALEDIGARTTGASASLWAAVRVQHGGVLRTPHGVLVASHKYVHQVLGDEKNYTVDGYARRMKSSFGKIFLGLDQGEQYRAESEHANAAVSDVSREDSLSLARQITVSWLDETLRGAATHEVSVEIKDLVDGVLAGLCHTWFGLPNAAEVVAGGWHWKEEPPPTCPGHFHSPSRYMFQPNPGREAEEIGQRHGKELKLAVKAWVRSLLGFPPTARITRALFHAIADPDQLASTIIGVMMGFLPTADGCLRGVLYEWVNDRSLWDLQIAYLQDQSVGPLAREDRVLLPPLIRTLHLRPVPEVVWRMAKARHTLGGVSIEPGDKVVVGLVSATQEKLVQEDESEETLYTVFGGNRNSPDGKHPTHACPGYEMAMGVMLGVLAGLLESATLRPTLSPMSLKLSRRASAAAAPAANASAGTAAGVPARTTVGPAYGAG